MGNPRSAVSTQQFQDVPRALFRTHNSGRVLVQLQVQGVQIGQTS
jgi:hypothetical protein